MKKLSLPLLAATLVLAAGCSPEAGAPEEETAPPPVVATSAPAADPESIPAAFHGSWDAPGGNCAPGSDLQLSIAGKAITYYESVGEVIAVSRRGPMEVEVTLAMEGEGESWERRETLQLRDEGSTLVTGESEKILREPCV